MPETEISPSANANKSVTSPSQYRKHFETGLEFYSPISLLSAGKLCETITHSHA